MLTKDEIIEMKTEFESVKKYVAECNNIEGLREVFNHTLKEIETFFEKFILQW